MSEYSVTNILCAIYRSLQPARQKTKIEMGLSRKYLWRRLSFIGMNLHDIHEKPTSFLRMIYQKKHCQLELKRIERGQNKRGLSDPKNFLRKETGL